MIVTRWQAHVIPDKAQINMLFETEGLEPVEEVLAPGTTIKDHRHPFDEIRMVVSGALHLNISGNRLLLRAGDRIEIPANTRHSKSTDGEQDCVSICASRTF